MDTGWRLICSVETHLRNATAALYVFLGAFFYGEDDAPRFRRDMQF